MASRAGIALALFLGLGSAAWAQVVRFETTVGSFDIVLNPNNLPVLQGHVDNMLRYVENGNYNGSWINRAGETETGEEFVLQMGGLFSDTKRGPLTLASTRPVAVFDPIEGEPASETGLSNIPGTVAMALRGGNQNSGTSSFFVNVRNNASALDRDFTVFGVVSDMTVVNQIMALPNVDLSDPEREPPFLGDSTTFGDVPVDANGLQVFIKRAFVVTDSMSVALAMAKAQETMALSAASAAAAAGAGGGASAAQLATSTVPEPSSCLLAMIAAFWTTCVRRRR